MRFLLVIFILIVNWSYSQDTTNTGGVNIIMSSKIDSLIKSKSNKSEVWRVQMDFSTDKNYLTPIKEKFVKYHPDMETKIYFDAPYWKLKVGSFDTREEAEDFIDSIRKYYINNGLFPVQDEHIRKKSTK
jgi:hypothetical protein